MKILFLCGCLAHGRDGVGDYTQMLAAELNRQGHSAAAIALNDHHVNKVVASRRMVAGCAVSLLRIPAIWSASARFGLAKEWMETFSPEWVSLQFVPFSFQQKGLPLGLAERLKSLKADAKMHIMFHELWVGLYGKNSLGTALKKFLQKELIFKMMEQLKPSLITTSNSPYLHKLRDYDAKILRLFGNIPLRNQAGEISPAESDSSFIAVHFGRFAHQLEDFEKQLVYFSLAAQSMKKKPKLTVIGGGGAFAGKSIAMAKSLLGDAAVSMIGARAAEEVSEQMSRAHVGISRSDFALIGKSGTTISMIEHGLPVLLRGPRPTYISSAEARGITNRLIFCGDEISGLPLKIPGKARIKEVTEDFISMLQAVEGQLQYKQNHYPSFMKV